MQGGIKKLIAITGTSILSIALISIGYKKVTTAVEKTNRNEQFAVDEYNIPVTSLDNYTKIYENNNFEYFFNHTNTVLKIRNKKSGFVWSTGADISTPKTLGSSCSSIKANSDEQYACAIDAGPNSKGSPDDITYYSNINQLMSFTYYEKVSNDKAVSSQSALILDSSKAVYSFYRHKLYSNEFIFKVNYVIKTGQGEISADYHINMRLTFTEQGMNVHIYDEDIYGEGYETIESISPFPRLGQSGGKVINCRIKSTDEDGYGSCDYSVKDATITNNDNTNLPGYIFVPDGSGALIRFDDVKYYDANQRFYFDVYGDPYRGNSDGVEFSKTMYVTEPDYVETKKITMPVWGVAYGNNQDAFVAYATSGEEYFSLIYQGRSKRIEYASIYPRFERNRKYSYTFGESSSILTLGKDEIYRYDIGLAYNFLQGDGDIPASYIGMALTYRNYLRNTAAINENVELITGPKVDFLICDVKKGIFGYSDVVISTTSEIIDMLKDLYSQGVNNITSSLYGWQNGGISKGKPSKVDFNTLAGGKSGFKNIVELAKEYNYRINFYQQYGLINEEQYSSFNAYCVKALSRDYGVYVLFDTQKPILWWDYVNANVAGKWLNDQADTLSKLGDNVGITTGGISNLLVPDYGKKLYYDGAANSLKNSTKEASSKVSLGGDMPNSYLWSNYSDFYNISVYNSQLQCETDSVPFLEIVLGGLVNMYAEYSNFSFYDTKSQLKMIEYNLNPSFMISTKENDDVMYTNARDWFSTGYDDYKETIVSINENVIPYLSLIKGKTLVKRVVDETNGELGLYINTYATFDSDGTVHDDKVVLAINYLDHSVNYVYNGETITIDALSVKQLGGN